MIDLIERYALIPWNAAGVYKACDAVKLFKLRSAAEKAASKAYEAGDQRNLVCRTVYLQPEELTT